MHRYYWAAKAVTQLNQILLLNIEERINGSETAPMRPINERFFDRAGMLEVAQRRPVPEQPARHPGDLPGLPADARAAGPVGAHAARAVQRARR
jgi:UTP:GlnB (protein PII) uridylyltransferase